MQNSTDTRSLNGISIIQGTDVTSTRILTVGGLLVCSKTTATCSASSNASATIKSTLVELDTLAGGGAATLSYLYLDQTFGDSTPDGTLVRITGKAGVTEITCTSSGNMQMNGESDVGIKPTNFINFIWVASVGKWVWSSGND